MKDDVIAKQIETYSNAIVGFAVLQGLAYSYTFGSNSFFNCRIRTASMLAETVVVMCVLLAILLAGAHWALGRMLVRIAGAHARVVEKLYWGKVVVILLFTLTPAALTYVYGVRSGDRVSSCTDASAHLPTAGGALESG